MSNPKLQFELNKIASIAQQMLNGLSAYASSTKEADGRSLKTGNLFSMTEARSLPLMNAHRVGAAINELEALGRNFSRDESKLTKPYQLDVNDIRLIYKHIVRPFSQLHARRARVIAGLNLKGGVGKTTLTANLASGLVCSRNMLQHQLRVLLIDLDPQGSASLAFGYSSVNTDDGASAVQAILKQIDADTLITWIKPTRTEGLDILPAFTSDAFFSIGAAAFAEKNNKNFTELLNEYVIKPLRDNYDVILLDCAPHLDATLLNSLAAADAMIIPIGLDPVEFDSSLKFLTRLKELFELIDSPLLTSEKLKFLPTKVNYTNERHIDYLNALNQGFHSYVLNKTMQFLRPFSQVLATQETIYELPPKLYQGSAVSFKKALADFDGLVAEVFSSLIAVE